MLRVVVRVALGSTTQARGSQWPLLRWCPSPVWAPLDVHGGKVREAPAQRGLLGTSGTFKSTAQLWAETEGLEAACAGGGQECPVSSVSGSVGWGAGQAAASANSLEPWEELRAAFWFVLAVWVQG